jgi:hypothetical protein
VSVFTAQIDEFIRKSQVLTTGVVREAAQSMIEEAQTSRFKGGKMPRVTGFLTNSGKAQIGSLPSGESRPPPGYMAGEWNGAGQLQAVLAQLKPGDIFYYGWTAVYARKMEIRYMFAHSAAQNWQQHVARAVTELKARIK